MIEIALLEIHKYYGANHVLQGVNLDVKQGERVALLGRNGAGKTTLFRIIAGTERQDEGERMVRRGAVIGILEQIPEFPSGYTAKDVLFTAYAEILEIHRQMQQCEMEMADGNCGEELLNKYGKLQVLYENQGGYRMEEELSRVCTGLKINEDLQGTLFCNLSGGEKTRVMLGCLMLQSPDILLLDEPTNHLDLSSIEWLEEFLRNYKGTAVIISHDRYFLDRVVQRVIELEAGKAEMYQGNYSAFVQEKEQRYQQQLQKYEQEQKKIEQLEAAAKRMHEWGNIADNAAMHRKAFNIEKRIERMDKTDKPVQERNMNSTFQQECFSSGEVLSMKAVCKRFGEQCILEHADMVVRKGERTAILGRNGAGKSTLLRILLGELPADQGTVKLGESITLAYLPQEVIFDAPQSTVLETVRNSLAIEEGKARGLLAKYRFRDEEVFKKVANLSGGEKSRLRLCLLMQKQVNLLVLDEPTNHLDIYSREWLESALEEYGGTLLFVSHDRYFIRKFADRISEIEGGKLYHFFGDYEYYKSVRNTVLEEKPLDKTTNKAPVQQKRNQTEPVSKTAQKRIQDLETTIGELEQALKEVLMRMEENAINFEQLQILQNEKETLEKRLEQYIEDWSSVAEAVIQE